jgi:hypothetical protein
MPGANVGFMKLTFSLYKLLSLKVFVLDFSDVKDWPLVY